jgi:4,5-DOPA dioxygenase extradiol
MQLLAEIVVDFEQICILGSMKRSEFIKIIGFASAGMVTLPNLLQSAMALPTDDLRMPALFVGHGSPMNLVSDNTFTRSLREWGQQLPRPKAILVISAHWLTRGTYVGTSAKPSLIYDFFGYPDELYKVKYPAVGSPGYAKITCDAIAKFDPMIDQDRGLDHGAWSVLLHMFPKADIPVFQMSIDRARSLDEIYRIGKQLQTLRAKGILVIGSGNVTHNQSLMAKEEDAPVPEWAEEFDIRVKNFLERQDDKALLNYLSWGKVSELAHPSNDHFLPLLYILAMRGESDALKFTYEGFSYGTLSMRSFQVG